VRRDPLVSIVLSVEDWPDPVAVDAHAVGVHDWSTQGLGGGRLPRQPSSYYRLVIPRHAAARLSAIEKVPKARMPMWDRNVGRRQLPTLPTPPRVAPTPGRRQPTEQRGCAPVDRPWAVHLTARSLGGGVDLYSRCGRKMQTVPIRRRRRTADSAAPVATTAGQQNRRNSASFTLWSSDRGALAA
jgi:hypothetical protein